MERFNFRRMGLLSIMSAISMAIQSGDKSLESMARGFYSGGYSNSRHGWSGKGRKFKRSGLMPRRSKAQRRARACR